MMQAGPLSNSEIFLRLAVATLTVGLLGINRDLRGKPAGLRTHALVALGCALLTILGHQMESHSSSAPAAMSRVIQGIVSGIGFLGAGVILRDVANQNVRGLTTAASIWMAAALGVACGAGYLWAALMALGLTLVVLITGGPIEQVFHRWFKAPASEESEES